ncbi:MAG: LysR family transcriptional regulator [Devosiaceae bacterium]|nr:LysR family transcriptional regulator [Devosiaceae bacterium]
MVRKNSTKKLMHAMQTRLRMRHFSLINSIVEQGSIHKASAIHRLSQPGVSKLLKEIETMFELPLFERAPSGTVPTVYGLRVYETFKSIITEMEHLAQELDAIRVGGKGIIRVGVINFISRTMISEAISNLRKSGQEIIVHLVNGDTEALVSSLHALELDCVVARKTFSKTEPEVNFLPVYRQEPCVIFKADTPVQAEMTAPDLLRRFAWVIPTNGTPGREELNRVLTLAGITDLKVIAESSDLDLIFNIVLSEPNVFAILPSDIGLELLQRGDIEMLPFNSDFEYAEVGIMELPRVARNPNVELFFQAMISAAQKHA